MKNELTLKINKPCSKNFNLFTPTKAGGFCNSCEKEVIDFTKMNSQEIIAYFKQNVSKKTCGRFTKHQLGTFSEATPSSKNYSFWKGVGIACLSIFSICTMQAQVKNSNTEINKITSTQKQNTIVVKGIVSDESAPLPGVSIVLEGTTVGVETDFNGYFEFPVKLKKGDILVFSFVGMDTQKIIVTNENSTSLVEMKIDMKMTSCLLLGDVVVKQVYSSKKNLKK